MENLPSFDETKPVDQSTELPAFEDTKPQAPAMPAFEETQPSEAMPSFQDTAPTKDYSTPDQQVMAGAEGMARGLMGSLAPLAETKLLGVKPEDIQGRIEANPVTAHGAEAGTFAASMLTGVGEAGLIAKAVPEFSRLAELGALGRVGAKALQGGLETAAMQGGDEISKRIIQPDASDTVPQALAHMGYAALLGSATGGVFGALDVAASKGLKAIEDQKISKRAESWLQGFGASHAGKSTEEMAEFIAPGMEDLDKSAFKAGANFQQKMPEILSKTAIDRMTEAAGALAGTKTYGVTGSVAGYHMAKQFIEPYMEKILQKPLSTMTKKYAVPYVTKALTSNMAQSVPSALEYGIQVAKGHQKLNNALNTLFKSGGQQSLDADIDEIKKNKIDQGIQGSILDQQIQNQGQPDQQNYAKGGEVLPMQKDHFAQILPMENELMQTARSRVYGHLSMLHPKKQPGLAFDHNEPTAEQKRSYDRALDLATNPLSILGHVKNNTLTSEHIQHMNAMWPEVNQEIHKGLTKKITEMQLKGEKPPYHLRQALSLILGTPLESAMSPMGIQAAQSVFLPKMPQQPAQGAPKMKHDTAKLGNKTNKMYNTVSQEAETDRSARD